MVRAQLLVRGAKERLDVVSERELKMAALHDGVEVLGHVLQVALVEALVERPVGGAANDRLQLRACSGAALQRCESTHSHKTLASLAHACMYSDTQLSVQLAGQV